MTATIGWPVRNVDEVEPVRPDVADGPERAALVGLEPPVPVGVEEQPVLEVVAGHEADVAELAGGDHLADVLVERVEPDVEVHGVHEAALRRDLDKLRRLGGRHRQRLLADDVPAGGQDLLRLGDVEVVGRGDVDDLDRRILEDGVERRVGVTDAEGLGTLCAALRRAAEHAADLDADAPQLLDVDRADEAGADDGGANVGDPAHGHSSNRNGGSIRSRCTSQGDAGGYGRPSPPGQTAADTIVL